MSKPAFQFCLPVSYQFEIAVRVAISRIGNLNSASRKNPRWLIEADTPEVTHVMKHCRRRQNKAVEPVEPSAMAWEQDAHVLDFQVAFDRGDEQVTELSADADDHPEQD